MVAVFDPEGYGLEHNMEERTLEQDESLVGVYGVKDRQKWFTSFGFIVVKKLPPNSTSEGEQVDDMSPISTIRTQMVSIVDEQGIKEMEP